jgi:hypothetical protein
MQNILHLSKAEAAVKVEAAVRFEAAVKVSKPLGLVSD